LDNRTPGLVDIKNLNVASDSTVVVDNLDMIGRFIRFSRYRCLHLC
jgi:hypothetical protein